MSAKHIAAILLMSLVFLGASAQAYIGPGAGAGTIAVVLGILASIVLAFFAILWYPVKRLLKKKKPPEESSEDPEAESPERQEER